MLNKINVKPQKRSRKKPQLPDEQFTYYWRRIENAEKAIKKIDVQRRNMVSTFNETLRPLEEQLCENKSALIQHLLTFCHKKSLAKYLKEEVLAWTEQEYQDIACSPFRAHIDMEALASEMMLIVKQLNPVPDELPDSERDQLYHMLLQLGFDADAFGDDDLDQLYRAMLQGPHAFLALLQSLESQHVFDDEDGFDEAQPRQEQHSHSEQADDFTSEQCQEDRETLTSKQEEDVFSKKSINRFYKKVAQRIHPDRAQTDEEKEERHDLMQTLTQAKDDQDIFTIFKLYQAHVQGNDLLFSNKEYTQLIRLLKDKLHTLEQKKRAFKEEGSVESMIYDRFHAKTQRETQSNLVNHENTLRQEIEQITSDHQRLTSLKQLKILLQERANQRVNYQEGSADFFDDLFGGMEN